MLDQVLGLLLFGLGLGKSSHQPSVKGETTEIQLQQTEESKATDDGTLLTTPRVERAANKAGGPLLTKPAAKFVPLPKKVLNDTQEASIKKRELELKTLFEARKSRVADELKLRRVEAIEKFKGDRETFERKVGEMKDTQRKAIVSRIDTKVSELNDKRTDDMTQRLTHMSEILDKIGVRASEAKVAGKNITTLDSLVTAARASVTSAQTVVNTQASKQYIAQIETIDGVGAAMKTTLSSLQTDMKTTFESVRLAHESVQKAVRELGVVLGKVETSTGGQE